MTNIAEYLKSEKREIELYHKNGELALYCFQNSNGYWYERTYDSNCDQLTYKDSDGVTRDYTVKQMTKEEAEKEFKIKIVE